MLYHCDKYIYLFLNILLKSLIKFIKNIYQIYSVMIWIQYIIKGDWLDIKLNSFYIQ